MSWRRGALALAAICAVAFALVAVDVLRAGLLPAWDKQVLGWVIAHRQPTLTLAALALSLGHRTVPVLAFTALLAALFVWRGRRRAALLLAVVPAAMLLNVGAKHLFQRARPETADALVHLSTFSFPSGHAAAATAFYGALCLLVFQRTASRATRAWAVGLAAAAVALVAASRVYLGAHYLSDVLAGSLLSLVWLSLARSVK